MSHEITMIEHRVTTTHTVHLNVTDVPDYGKSYSRIVMAPERLILKWTKYDDDDWGNPRVGVVGRRRNKGDRLGAETRDAYASATKVPWINEIIEEVKPS